MSNRSLNKLREVFPSMPVGKTILDVYCEDADILFWALSEGAAWCAGMDRRRDLVSLVHSLAGYRSNDRITVQRRDVLAVPVGAFANQFHFVVCLGLIEKFRHIGKVGDLLLRAESWAIEKAIFRVIPPEADVQWGKHEDGSLRVAASYFEEFFSKPQVKTRKSEVFEGQLIVEVSL